MCPHKARSMSSFCHGFNKNITTLQCNLAVYWRDTNKEIQVDRWCSPKFLLLCKSLMSIAMSKLLWSSFGRLGREMASCSWKQTISLPQFWLSFLLENFTILFSFHPHVLVNSQNLWCNKRKKHERETKLVCILCSFPLKNTHKLKAPQAFLQIDCIRIQESKE